MYRQPGLAANLGGLVDFNVRELLSHVRTKSSFTRDAKATDRRYSFLTQKSIETPDEQQFNRYAVFPQHSTAHLPDTLWSAYVSSIQVVCIMAGSAVPVR